MFQKRESTIDYKFLLKKDYQLTKADHERPPYIDDLKRLQKLREVKDKKVFPIAEGNHLKPQIMPSEREKELKPKKIVEAASKTFSNKWYVPVDAWQQRSQSQAQEAMENSQQIGMLTKVALEKLYKPYEEVASKVKLGNIDNRH